MSPLLPNPQAFTASHPDWLADVADLVTGARVGTTFGLYGRWGSGKSSAALALIPAIYTAARRTKRICQVVVVDATNLRGDHHDNAAVARAIANEVSFQDSSKLTFAEMRKGAYRAVSVFAKALEKLPDPMAQASAHSLDTLSTLGVQLAESGRPGTAGLAQSPELDRIVLVFDDLDRCPPNVAIRILEIAVMPLIEGGVTTIVVCDPGVLAAHAASVFGVPIGDGLRAVAKYIHVAIHVPVRTSLPMKEALLARIPAELARRDEVSRAALVAAETVPIRDVMTALPQGALWVRVFERSGAPSESPLRMFIALSVVSTALPQVFEVVQRSPLPVFRDLIREYSRGQVLQAPSRFASVLSEPMVRQLRQRLDLVELGQRLGGVEFTADEAQRMLAAINGWVGRAT